MNNAAAAAKAKMVAMTEARSTEQLFSDLAVLESQTVGYGTEEQRLVAAIISDTIETRHNLTPALEAIFDDEEWFGTYNEALRMALLSTYATVALADA